MPSAVDRAMAPRRPSARDRLTPASAVAGVRYSDTADPQVGDATAHNARPADFTWPARARGRHLRTDAEARLSATRARTHGVARAGGTSRPDHARRASRGRRPRLASPRRARARRVPALRHPRPRLRPRPLPGVQRRDPGGLLV